jgi:hypothetical protein
MTTRHSIIAAGMTVPPAGPARIILPAPTGPYPVGMMMTADFTRAEPPVAQFWSHLTGWRLDARHGLPGPLAAVGGRGRDE